MKFQNIISYATAIGWIRQFQYKFFGIKELSGNEMNWIFNRDLDFIPVA